MHNVGQWQLVQSLDVMKTNRWYCMVETSSCQSQY